MERRSQGTRAGSQEGQWSPQGPGVTNRGSGERAPHTMGGALKRSGAHTHRIPGAAQVVALAAARQGGECVARRKGEWFQQRRPGSPGPRVTKPRIWRSPWAIRGGRTQDSEDAPATGHTWAVQVSATNTQCCQALADWELQDLMWELTFGLESWPLPVLLFLPSHLAPGLEWGGQGTWASQDKQLPGSRAPGRGWGSSPGAHTWLSAEQDPPSQDQLEGKGKSKFLTKQRWKAPGGSWGTYSI